MSLKAVELQVTIPRTHDAGRIQEQLQNRNINEQAHLSNEQKKEIEKQQNSATEVNKTEKEKIKDQNKQKQQDNQQQSKNKNKKNNQNKIQHPYKGKSVDISL